MSLSLHVLGSAGSWPASGLPSSGYVVADGSTRVVMDLGFGTMVRLDDPLDVDAVVMSHRHPDHCADVLALFQLWGHGPDRRSGVPLIGPQSTIDALAAFVDAGPGHRFWEVFAPQPVVHGDTRTIGTLSFDFVDVDHSAPTVGMRVESASRSLFYTGDTGLAGEWWTAVDQSDTVLAEASWQGDGDGGDYTQHLTAAQAGAIAASLGAERLILAHLKPGLDPVRSVAEAHKTFPGTVLHADPGLTIEV
jgi:ribonuclease BN (tRNA processing enzyme)